MLIVREGKTEDRSDGERTWELRLSWRSSKQGREARRFRSPCGKRVGEKRQRSWVGEIGRLPWTGMNERRRRDGRRMLVIDEVPSAEQPKTSSSVEHTQTAPSP